MLTIRYQTAFKKDFKKIKKRGYDISQLEFVIQTLVEQKTLDEKYRDHALSGNWNGYRECHITSDWLLIYKVIEGELILLLTRTGTHSDLFNE